MDEKKKCKKEQAIKKMGRPEKEINWEHFEQLCSLQCTQSEICSFLKTNDKTLVKHILLNYKESYSEAYKKYSEVGKCSLRRYQFTQARTSATMAIWLGKQWLGQKDHDKMDAPPNDRSIEMIGHLIKLNSQLEAKIAALSKTNCINITSQQSI